MPALVLKAKGRPVFRHAGLVIDNRFRTYDVTDEQAEALRAYVGRFLIEQPAPARSQREEESRSSPRATAKKRKP